MARAPRILIHSDQTAPQKASLLAACPGAQVGICDTNAGLPAAISTHRPDVVYSVRFDPAPGFPAKALFAEGGPVWVANGGAGTDHLGHWNTDRVTVTNAAGVAADMIAEYVMGCILHFTLDVPGFVQDKALRRWQMRSVEPVKDKTMLIVGLGHTGRAVAARAKAFGMQVTGTRASPEAMENVDDVRPSGDLLQLLPQADVVVVCTPLTDDTRDMLSANAIGVIKEGAVFVDVSRGGVTDQDALCAALNSGRIAGAALDVFPVEPLPPSSPLWNTANLLISPHCSAVHKDWDEASFALFLRNLDNWLNGRPLFNVVDPDRGY